jgi:hypothetical protein
MAKMTGKDFGVVIEGLNIGGQQMPKLLRDGVGRVSTDTSLNYFEAHKAELGAIKEIFCTKLINYLPIEEGETRDMPWVKIAGQGWATTVIGEKAVMVLTGFALGYNGWGPGGLEQLCRKAGFVSVPDSAIESPTVTYFIWNEALERDAALLRKPGTSQNLPSSPKVPKWLRVRITQITPDEHLNSSSHDSSHPA